MPGISIHYDIRVACQSLIQAQCGQPGLLQALPANNVLVRTMPKVGEVVNTLPCVIIAPVTPVRWEPADFEGGIFKTYLVEFAIVAASNQDYQANQELYEGWLEQLGRIVIGDLNWLLVTPPGGTLPQPSCPSVWNIEIDHEATFDRGKLSQNYAYQSILGIYYSKETRTGLSYAG